jgi:hypothetical protein
LTEGEVLKLDFTDESNFLNLKELSFGIYYAKYREDVKDLLDNTNEKVHLKNFVKFMVVACIQIKQRFFENSEGLKLLSLLNHNILFNLTNPIVGFTKLLQRYEFLTNDNLIHVMINRFRRLINDLDRVNRMVINLEKDHKKNYESKLEKNSNRRSPLEEKKLF